MRDVCLKLTEKVIKQAEQLTNLTDPQNKFDENILLSEILS